MSYSNAAIFGSEAISTCIAIYLGESVIANEVLTATKGRNMGWGFVALGFGLSFGIGILILGYISAHMNPATCLALVILGKMDGVTFIAAVGGEFLGAFVGAVLVWVHFLPHFKTVPEPLPHDETDLLLRSRDALTPSALGIVSYNTRESDVIARQRGVGSIKSTLQDIRYYLLNESHHIHEPIEGHNELIQVALGRDEVKGVQIGKENYLRRRSAQVCDVHRRLKDVDMEDFKMMLTGPSLSHKASMPAMHLSQSNGALDTGPSLDTQDKQQQQQQPAEQVSPALTKRQEKLDKLYDAAVIADQNAKLSIFATRPAIFAPIFNFICEFMCTTILIYGALMIYETQDQLQPEFAAVVGATDGLVIGIFIFVLVLGLGGPTGIAANPARDFGPRMAHFVLPIAGKGRSEFYYAWVPFFAPFVGGCAAAGLYAATQTMNRSNV